MSFYNHKKIEKKWQIFWEVQKLFYAEENSSKPKFYALIEFPYPSGEGLHVGHPRPYTAMDIISRKKRMEGYNVLYPIGFDAFGLPTENYAIKTRQPPAKVTKKNIANFRRQIKSLGISFDWSREVNTTDPSYYKWTQWIFLQLFKHGLAYKARIPINWCLNCKISLANEEVARGACERCGGPVEKRLKDQWILAITKYADKLLEGLREVSYIPQARIQQENWIGRSEGINITYQIEGTSQSVTVFTTRPDTNFGATFVVIAPDAEFVRANQALFSRQDVRDYIEEAKRKSDLERIAEGRKKTGVFTGYYAINNLTRRRMPIYVSDFVLGSVGTGVVVGVPGHDIRDFEFARGLGIEIIRVVVGQDGDTSPINKPEQVQEDVGTMMNSDFLNGLDIHEATRQIMDYLEAKGWGRRVKNYKLRDWVFSRQRYWGEPIPLVHCEACAARKYNYIIIHGFNTTSRDGFRPWLESELKKAGHAVWNPDLPHADKPNLEEQARYIMDNAPFKIDKQTIVVGHSLGGPVIYTLLQRLKQQIAKAVLVDPVYLPEFNDEPRKAVEESTDWQFDWERIRARCKEFVIVGDKNFPIIKETHLRELSASLNCGLWLEEPSRPHFSARGEVIHEARVLEACVPSGWISLPENTLPLILPAVKKYEPTDTGESPLAAMEKWVRVECPRCGGLARRETDTMPNWAGSSWYFLRYTDPHNDVAFASLEQLQKWMPVDWYNGGMEHTVLHLLYSRFWNQFLYDIGVAPCREPYKKRTSHGMILAKGGEKMSKSKGNVVNPDEIVEKYGADTLRTYIMFMGPFDQAAEWDPQSLVGVRRFLERVWVLCERVQDGAKYPHTIEQLVHQSIKKVSEDIESMNLNTPVAQLMALTNALYKLERVPRDSYERLLILLSPYAPHICEELWEMLGHAQPIMFERWPQYKSELLKADNFELVIQINGKVRDKYSVPYDSSEAALKEAILARPKVQMYLKGSKPKQFRYIKGRLVSIVT